MKIRIFAFIAFCLFTVAANASLRGALWDPTQGGEGWTFESQNDVVAGTWYMYEADGSPSFRTFVAQSTTNSQGQFVLNGDLYRIVTRGTSVREGAFTGTFSFQRGAFRGTVNAAGNIRNLESFNYAFAEPLDRLHGIWSFSLLGAGVSESIAVQFSRNVLVVNGLRTKQFVTSLGQPGAVLFDGPTSTYVGIASVGNGQYYCFEGDATDDATVGIGYYGNANCARSSATFYNVGKSFVNTEGEYAASGQQLRAILGFQSFPPQSTSKHAEDLESMVRALSNGNIQRESAAAKR